ncbi:HNH endonuclease [Anaerobaca lacustris]|uniref:HNH endonuclease n=1 Tax=Anaerobaca lacustris TaxID=3044600 RepID=A0AAW6U350_9BACT|nr:HNH endonuclease [Sedimentisphaerales bacterium M17dextr]
MSKRRKVKPPDEADAESKPPQRKWKPPRVPPPDSPIWPEQYRGKNWKSVYAVLFEGKCLLCVHSCPLSKWRQGEDKFQGQPRLLLCTNHPDHPGELHEVLPIETCRRFAPKRWRSPSLHPPKRRVRATTNEYDPEVRRIHLGNGLFATVDAEDYEQLRKYRWYAIARGRNVYATAKIDGRTVYMHRMLMKPREGYVVDHIDGNGLNNRRCNLRVCTPAQNLANKAPCGGSSQFVGVYRYRDKWMARAVCRGKHYHLGIFADEVEAAKARDRKAYELHGEYAYLNFPEDFTS